jgi:hypothetical protein
MLLKRTTSVKHLQTLEVSEVRKALYAELDSPHLFDLYTKVVKAFPNSKFAKAEAALEKSYDLMSQRLYALVPQLAEYCKSRDYIRDYKQYSKGSVGFIVCPIYTPNIVFHEYQFSARKREFVCPDAPSIALSGESLQFAKEHKHIRIEGALNHKGEFEGHILYVMEQSSWVEYGYNRYTEHTGVIEASGDYNGSLLFNVSMLQKFGVYPSRYRTVTTSKEGLDAAVQKISTSSAVGARISISDTRIRHLFSRKGYSADCIVVSK